MKKRSKKTLMESATDLAESVRPAIESALETAVETAKDTVDTAMEKAAPILAEGREVARDKAAPILAEGKEKARRGRRRAAVKLAALKEAEASQKAAAFKDAEPKKKGGRLKKLVLLSGLAAVGGVIFKRLRGAPSKSNWQSSYVPQPAPRQAPADAAARSESPVQTTPTADAAADAAEAPPADDEGAASPDEALADRATEPHPDTTPDNPAEVVELHAVEDTAASEAPAADGARKNS